MQKEDLPSYKLEDHAYESQNPIGLKEDNLTEKLPDTSLSHIKQECWERFTPKERFRFNKI